MAGLAGLAGIMVLAGCARKLENTVDIQANLAEVCEYIPEPDDQVTPEMLHAWEAFKAFCDCEQYKEALQIYEEGENNISILSYIRDYNTIYLFLDSVLAPIRLLCQETEDALKSYTEDLRIEYILCAIKLHGFYDQQEGIEIPEVTPFVIRDLGTLMAKQGNMDEAMELMEDYAYAVYGLGASGAFLNLSLATLTSGYQEAAGNYQDAIQTLQDYIDYTSDEINRDPGTPASEYDEYIQQAKQKIEVLKREL